MIRWLVCATTIVTCSSQAAAINIWLSTSDQPSAPPAVAAAVPTIHNFQSQGTGSVFVWARPDDTETLARWSLRLTSSNPALLSFDASEIEGYNLLVEGGDPELIEPSDQVRWEFTGPPAGDSSHVDLFGFNISSSDPARMAEGIGPACNNDDPFCGAAGYPLKDSWLLAKINYSLSAVVGQSELFFQIGSAGINHEGETTAQTLVTFGHSGDGALNGETDRLINSSTKDGWIVVHADPDADFDSDSDVDGRDFLTWQRGMGNTGVSATKAKGDATASESDDRIDEVDVAAWELQFGMGLGGLAALRGDVVPEPATGAWAAALFLFVLAGRRPAVVVGHPINSGAI